VVRRNVKKVVKGSPERQLSKKDLDKERGMKKGTKKKFKPVRVGGGRRSRGLLNLFKRIPKKKKKKFKKGKKISYTVHS